MSTAFFPLLIPSISLPTSIAESIDTQDSPCTSKWNLVDVADSKKLGSPERVKMRKQQQEFAKMLEECVQPRVAAIEARTN